jgi:ABC-type thiamine transport system ATPase subunit
MTYDINTINITQKTGTGNISYNVINGYWNTINNTQNGSDNFSLINITGDNNSATVNQTGSGHSTLLNLIGNRNNVSVTQTGIGDTYSLQQTCTNPAGCSVSVIRNK